MGGLRVSSAEADLDGHERKQRGEQADDGDVEQPCSRLTVDHLPRTTPMAARAEERLILSTPRIGGEPVAKTCTVTGTGA